MTAGTLQVFRRVWVGIVSGGTAGGVPPEEKFPVQNREGGGGSMGTWATDLRDFSPI